MRRGHRDLHPMRAARRGPDSVVRLAAAARARARLGGEDVQGVRRQGQAEGRGAVQIPVLGGSWLGGARPLPHSMHRQGHAGESQHFGGAAGVGRRPPGAAGDHLRRGGGALRRRVLRPRRQGPRGRAPVREGCVQGHLRQVSDSHGWRFGERPAHVHGLRRALCHRRQQPATARGGGGQPGHGALGAPGGRGRAQAVEDRQEAAAARGVLRQRDHWGRRVRGDPSLFLRRVTAHRACLSLAHRLELFMFAGRPSCLQTPVR
mmetsp:Transcript_82117/g.214249  ORF Transcript_82117/g.214249 Transcript_82117/m.214249 type:complete len:262 (+) Transcript_82117:508-1293(+)